MNLPHIHISIIQRPDGRVEVVTNEPAPAIGRAVAPAQSLAMDVLRLCMRQANEVRFHPDEPPLLKFARRFLNPEDLGYSVNPYVRDCARIAVGIPPCEFKGPAS